MDVTRSPDLRRAPRVRGAGLRGHGERHGVRAVVRHWRGRVRASRHARARRIAALRRHQVTVEINLAAVADEQASLEMIAETDKAGSIIARAGQVTAAVREQIRA